MKNIEVEIFGLKCDADGCGYRDDSIQFENYENYIDAPCPECGANLLTQADFNLVKTSLQVVDMINEMPLDQSGPEVTVQVEMDGSGIPKIT